MVFLFFQQAIGKIIDDLELFICCSEPEEYEGQVLFLTGRQKIWEV
jgi:hypothetical protein